MDCKYLYLTNDQLGELRDGIADGELWSLIYSYLKEPEELCEITRQNEIGMEMDEDDETLSRSIYGAKSVFVAKLSVDDENRVDDCIKLLKDEIINKLHKDGSVFLYAHYSEENKLTVKQFCKIADPIDCFLNGEGSLSGVRCYDDREERTTDLYLVEVEKGDCVIDEDEVIDDVLDEINKLDFGEYRDVLLKKAEDYAKLTIGDPENHKDAVVVCMINYLNGASETLKLVKENSQKSKSGK